MRTTHHSVRIGLRVALSMMAAGSAATAQEYDVYVIEALSEFGIPEAYLFDVNNDGVAVGAMTYTTRDSNGNAHTTYHGFRWSADTGPEVHPTPSWYDAINDRGDIVAGASILFADGRSAVMSPAQGDRSVSGSEINESGTVVGTSTFRYYSGCRYSRRAIVWSEEVGTVSLDSQVPSADVGMDINEFNDVVGNASYSGSCGDFEAFLLRTDTGEWVDLHRMLVGDGPGITEAIAVNDLGQVLGEGWNGSFSSGWVWDEAGGFEYLPALKQGDQDRVRPADINNSGLVVGSAATDGWADPVAFIWDAVAGMRDLNDLVDAPQDFILDRATAISDSGVIVGDGHWGPGFGLGVAFVLVPVQDGCDADFNGDGEVNTLDVLAFLNAWNDGEPGADVNGDGEINTLDVLAFLNDWNTGC